VDQAFFAGMGQAKGSLANQVRRQRGQECLLPAQQRHHREKACLL